MAIAAFKPAPIFKPIDINSEALRQYVANDSAWMQKQRAVALTTLQNTPIPTRIDEIWRRVDLNRFNLNQALQLALTSNTSAATEPSDWTVLRNVADAPGWLMHVNGVCTAQRLDPALAAQGVVYCSLDQATREHTALLDQYLMTQCVKPTDTFFAALHATLMRGGVVLYVPAGVSIEAPLRAGTWLSADHSASFHHTLVVMGAGAKAKLVEEFGSPTAMGETAAAGMPTQAAGAAMINSSVEILLGDNAQLDYVSIQDYGRHTYNFSTERAKVGENATLHWVVGGIGSRFTKTAIEADMVGSKGTALLSGVYFADSKQQMHYDTQQNHIAEGCVSDLLYKAALRDEARTVWRGNIRVFPGAQKTDSYQANRNLQLSDKSRADSIPGLEIEADDVRCTHGATVGQIETEPMFYLESRGIPPIDARRLIVEGFFAPVIERIPLAETRERLLEEIGKKI